MRAQVTISVIIALIGLVIMMLPYLPCCQSTFLTPYTEFLRNLGGLIVGAVGCAALLSHSLTRSVFREFKEAKDLWLEKGLVDIYGSRAEMQTAVRRGEPYSPSYLLSDGVTKNVKVLGIDLNDFTVLPQNHEREASGWFKEGIKYEFLLLDPDSEFFKQRFRDERTSTVDWQKDTKTSFDPADHKNEKNTAKRVIRILKNIRDSKRFNLDIRTYDIYPTVSLIIRDDKELFIGPYLFQAAGTKTPWFKLVRCRGDCPFNKYLEHFERIRDSNRSRPQ